MIAAMEELVLRAMTTVEFDAYRARCIPEYAEDHVRAGDWSAEQAEGLAARQIDELLPAGPATPGMLLLSAETADGGSLGLVWPGFRSCSDRLGHESGCSPAGMAGSTRDACVTRPEGGWVSSRPGRSG